MSTNSNSGNISILNSCNENINTTFVRYDYEKYPDIKPFTLNPGNSKSWERYPNRSYFCFLAEAKILYGFLCKGGKDYEYLGKGQMTLPTEKKYYKLDFDIKDVKNEISILAVLEDVEISIFKDNENLKDPLFTKKMKKNNLVSQSFVDGYYYLKINGDQTIYGVIPGIAYYIAKGQVLVEVDTNIIKKPHKNDDIEIELE